MGNQWVINPDEPFCMYGEWFLWKDMTPIQRKKKVEVKISMAGASKDEPMEEFWKNVDLGM